MVIGLTGAPASARAPGKRLAAVAFLSAFASVALGLAFGNRWLLPALNALSLYPFYIRLILHGQRRRAAALALLWALFMSQAVIAATLFFPDRAESTILRGAEYRDDMFDWIATGEGAESSPSVFLPSHAKEFALFCALALVSGGAGALFLGAILLNYMNFYVGALLASSSHPLLAALLAWPPYSIIRVIAYIILATALSEAFLGILHRRPVNWRKVAKYAAVGAALAILDVLVKILAAPYWAKLLKSASGL